MVDLGGMAAVVAGESLEVVGPVVMVVGAGGSWAVMDYAGVAKWVTAVLVPLAEKQVAVVLVALVEAPGEAGMARKAKKHGCQ